jgi:hypothetical protein
VGEAFANSDLVNNEPLISGLSQRIASNKDLDLVLGGYFTSRAIDAIRESCSGVRLLSNSTPSSAITFSTMFSPAISIACTLLSRDQRERSLAPR